MDTGGIAEAERLMRDAVAAFRAAGALASDDERLEMLRVSHRMQHELVRVDVDTVAGLERAGVFAKHGQRPHTALSDLLGIEYQEARRVVTAADAVCPRTDLQGQVLPPRLPGTAAAFGSGAASLRHVEVVAGLMASETAGHLAVGVRESAEGQIAALAGEYTPSKLRDWGQQLLSLLDQDGVEPDDRDPVDTNEVHLTRGRTGGGGSIRGRFTDPAMYEVIAALIAAKAAPLTADDTRPLGQRQAEAMAEIFGFVADHGDAAVAPASGGRRPHVNVHIRLEDLENRARAAMLDFAGAVTPDVLRRLCCDACVVPVVLNGMGMPLDVGRQTRTIPDPLRRAVTARDRGCAHPGCTRPPSWCQVHHITPWEYGGETKLSNLVMLCLLCRHRHKRHYADLRIMPMSV